MKISQLNKLTQDDLDERLISACADGNLEMVKCLLTHPSLGMHANIHAQEEQPLFVACSNKQAEVVKFLVSSPDLQEHASISAHVYRGVQIALEMKAFKVVKIIVESPKITKEEVKQIGFKGIIAACAHENLSFLRYLIEEKNLAHYTGKKQLKYFLSKMFPVISFKPRKKTQTIIDYLLYDYKLPLTDELKQSLVDCPQILKLFTSRDLHESLQEKLPPSHSRVASSKI